jgi:hypothetical protein
MACDVDERHGVHRQQAMNDLILMPGTEALMK